MSRYSNEEHAAEPARDIAGRGLQRPEMPPGWSIHPTDLRGTCFSIDPNGVEGPDGPREKTIASAWEIWTSRDGAIGSEWIAYADALAEDLRPIRRRAELLSRRAALVLEGGEASRTEIDAIDVELDGLGAGDCPENRHAWDVLRRIVAKIDDAAQRVSTSSDPGTA